MLKNVLIIGMLLLPSIALGQTQAQINIKEAAVSAYDSAYDTENNGWWWDLMEIKDEVIVAHIGVIVAGMEHNVSEWNYPDYPAGKLDDDGLNIQSESVTNNNHTYHLIKSESAALDAQYDMDAGNAAWEVGAYEEATGYYSSAKIKLDSAEDHGEASHSKAEDAIEHYEDAEDAIRLPV